MFDEKEIWFFVLGAIAFVALVIGLGMWGDYYACHSRWERAGYKCEWGPVQGCMLQRKDGSWIPADAIRDIEANPSAAPKTRGLGPH